jgi:hypothetical protein
MGQFCPKFASPSVRMKIVVNLEDAYGNDAIYTSYLGYIQSNVFPLIPHRINIK